MLFIICFVQIPLPGFVYGEPGYKSFIYIWQFVVLKTTFLALTVEAALTGKREHIYHAAMLDPHTAAELDLDQIWNLVDDLIEAHDEWLPTYDAWL